MSNLKQLQGRRKLGTASRITLGASGTMIEASGLRKAGLDRR